MKKKYLYVALLFAALGTFSCKSTKVTDAPKPNENYTMKEEVPLISTITVPVSILIEEMARNLNVSMSSKALYEDLSYDDNNRDDLMMTIWKSRDIELFVSGNTIKYKVPLQLWIKRRLLIGEAEATGELALSFKTTYQVNPDWSLTTQTIVEYHEWLKSPVLKTGMGNISIESIANIALNRSKKTLSTTLDRMINQQFSLKPYIEEAWLGIQEPVLLSDEYKLWVKTTPLKIGMTPIITDWKTMRTNVSVECYNDVTFGEKPFFRENTTVPNLTILNDTQDDFQMQFATDVPFPEAERLAKNMMLGQVFESGKNKVKIEDLKIWGNNEKLIVLAQLSGSFKGKIYFMGKPRFNEKKNAVEVADLDFHVDTKNMLHRSASWMFQGPIKKQMAAAMTFPLDENINTLKQSVQESLKRYEIQPGVILSGQLDSVRVTDTHLTPTGIRVGVFSKGKVKVDVGGN